MMLEKCKYELNDALSACALRTVFLFTKLFFIFFIKIPESNFKSIVPRTVVSF